MPSVSRDWGTQQLAEFMASISTAPDESKALASAIERAAEALEAEVGVILRSGKAVATVGFGRMDPPVDTLQALVAEHRDSFELPALGSSRAVAVPLEDDLPGVMMLIRSGEDRFTRAEEVLLRSMARVTVLVCRMLRTVMSERDLRGKSEQQTLEIEALLTSLLERQQLLEKLSRIQSSISHRKPLQEVLDSITTAAAELLDSEVSGLRLIDPDEPNVMITLSAAGVSSDELQAVHKLPVGEGAGGLAVSENRLIVMEHYDDDPHGLEVFRDRRLQTAMATPVHENDEPIGSLVVASYRQDRSYSEQEKAVLVAFANHASLALQDAKTVEAMREAQRSKDMFLAMVSHELKTPLTVIMGALRTLQRYGGKLDPKESVELLEAAFDRGRELQRLIDKLLQGAQAELADALSQAFIPDVVNEAVRGFEHSFRVKVHEVPQVSLEIAAASIERLIGILIENALSHSPSSSPILVGADLDRDSIAFWVRNEGELPTEDVSELFLPFQRGSDATSPGVGLGLYIASRIAKSLDGTLAASSADGVVRFTLRLPLKKSSYVSLKGSNLP